MAANPFRKTPFAPCPPGIALLKGRGVLFRSAAFASLMHGLRGERQDPALILLPLGTQLFDRTGLTGDGGKAQPDHLLASVVSSRAPVLREMPLGTTHLLLLPIHLERAQAIARLVLPSPLLFERAHQFDPELSVAGEHLAPDIATIDQPLRWHEVAGLQIAQ